MFWGFDFDDGWYDLVDTLCSQLDLIHKKTGIRTIATQAKEKYGGLRFYTVNDFDPGRTSEDNDKDVFDLIILLLDKAEEASYSKCEICGSQGSAHVKGGWYKTLCSDHAIQEGYDKFEGKSIEDI